MSSAETPAMPTRPTLDVGILVAPGALTTPADALLADLTSQLNTDYPQVSWNLVSLEDRLTELTNDIAPSGLDFLEAARDRMLDEDWDLAVALTDLPLKDDKRVVKTQLSPVHSVGVVVVPALGAVNVRAKVKRATIRVIEEILDFDDDDDGEDIVRRARQRSQDVTERAGENPAQFAARVLGGNLNVILGLVRANQPMTLALKLSRLIAATAGAGAFMLITPDIWVLASHYGPIRLGALTLIALLTVTISLIVGAGLWEKPRRRSEREQVTLFNAATILTVLIGVATFYLAVYVLAVVGSAFLLEAKSFDALASETLTTGNLLNIAWMVASLATVGGAVGAGLEEDDLVRSAAYTQTADDDEDEGDDPTDPPRVLSSSE